MSAEVEKTRLVFRVLGTKVLKCNELLKLLQVIIDRYGLNAEIKHEEEPQDIRIENFSDIPLLLINDRLVSKGRVPLEKELVRQINRSLPEDESIMHFEGPKPKKKFKVRWTMVVFVIAVIVFVITKVSWSPGERSNIPMNMNDSIQLEYNYVKNGKDFQFTFIELYILNLQQK